MKEQTAYAIAIALEKKCEEPIGLRSTFDVWEWHRDGISYAVLKNTDSPAQGIAQNAYKLLQPPPIRLNKRRPMDD